MAVIAHKPSDLVREGEALHHCVGRMNYDRKFVLEESLIVFIRRKESTPLDRNKKERTEKLVLS